MSKVQVVQGRVVTAEEANELARQPQQGTGKPAPGVTVKPHEWGATPFYATARGEKRAGTVRGG